MARRATTALAVALALAAGLTLTALPERSEAVPAPALLSTASWREQLGAPAGTPEQDAAWLAAGTVPGAGGPWEDVVRRSLLDLRSLTAANGAVAAGPAAKWRYAWPRDSAFAAVALSATGHRAEALRVLGFLAGVQHDDGGFEARYLLDGSGTPDGRGRQADGAGWALWALERVVADAPTRAQARAELRPLRGLLEGATRYALAATDGGTALPEPSSDYWERREAELTLGTVAPLLAGLRASAALHPLLGQRSAARRLGAAADTVEELLHERFAPTGYLRYADPGVQTGGVDAAVAFLLPPFAREVPAAPVLAAFDAYQVRALRPAGGLAPGAGWKRDGISWTPEVALVALAAAASGRQAQAARWLDWLAAHRTGWGSLPEKVLADGAPAGPAPLGWTAASVVLAVAALDAPGTAGDAP
ncbi:glycoside hydrolase family 15 protein [Kineococcus indalonis]|uniref:glycoside hydrolase family 15 n=1 Tax=Kineococcus indalonis TaxID=2696566 RepID=UPI001412F6D1|nr:glycoside hydrolase family 15 [Kineococcus indalonis]NAZ88286.1 glycoside hydrolase family 15 [Kineococcus indalonis]